MQEELDNKYLSNGDTFKVLKDDLIDKYPIIGYVDKPLTNEVLQFDERGFCKTRSDIRLVDLPHFDKCKTT